MNIRQDLITNALSERFNELRHQRILLLAPENFDERFVSRLREELMNTSLPGLGTSLFSGSAPGAWMNSDLDCLSSLRALSLGEPLHLREAVHPPIGGFLDALTTHRRDPDRRFQLLTERYACPINFTLPAEKDIREHILTRLMVQDRASIEEDSVAAINGDDLLLKLNLVGVYALVSSDLRFLDALNYYYELLPADWVPRAHYNWLLASYFSLYARALAVRIPGKHTIAHSHTLKHSASSVADL